MAIQTTSYMMSYETGGFAGKVEAVEIGGGILGGNILQTGKLWEIILLVGLYLGWRY